jgi:uncharacterized membrane protein
MSANALPVHRSPSRWSRRAPLVVLALVGCGIASYLSLYQVGVLSSVWDPIFGPDSSQRVLGSGVSRALPVPDATLGVLAYLADAILGLVGGQQRWRTMPWIVLLFGLVVAGLVLTGLVLVLTQVFVVQAGCTLCLTSAAISFITGWLARDEIAAALGHVRRARARGQSLWQALRGEPFPEGRDGRYATLAPFPQRLRAGNGQAGRGQKKRKRRR